MAAKTIQQEQFSIFGGPRNQAAAQSPVPTNYQPFGPNLDGIARALSSYNAMFTPGLGQSVNPILRQGGEADYADWERNSATTYANDYMETPKGQYVMYGLAQQQRLPTMQQSNTENQFKAFILAINAAFQKGSSGR